MGPETGGKFVRLPTRLDRYPAKMVAQLADRLIDRYAQHARCVLDPFCGSGAIVTAARRKGISVSAVDVNPVAALFCRAKFNGFDLSKAMELVHEWIGRARHERRSFPVQWDNKSYWFTPATLTKFERLRFVGRAMKLDQTNEGIALLLSYALAVRLCSKADQRSPKPFISKGAIASRRGNHFDPFQTIVGLLRDLSALYPSFRCDIDFRFVLADVSNSRTLARRLGRHSHIITSPPYINAQDYFRNFKLELYLLEDLIPFRVDDLRDRFIGTERGNLTLGVSADIMEENRVTMPQLCVLEHKCRRLAAVVHRYLCDMRRAFDVIKKCLDPKGYFVIVCGDNLIGGIRIKTWRVLQAILEDQGFQLVDRFADRIQDRLLPPKRCGHKGLIKEEVVSAFQA